MGEAFTWTCELLPELSRKCCIMSSLPTSVPWALPGPVLALWKCWADEAIFLFLPSPFPYSLLSTFFLSFLVSPFSFHLLSYTPSQALCQDLDILSVLCYHFSSKSLHFFPEEGSKTLLRNTCDVPGGELGNLRCTDVFWNICRASPGVSSLVLTSR